MDVGYQSFTPELVSRIQEFIDANPSVSRTKLSVQVCEWLNWKSPNGKWKEMSCRVALLRLHKKGILTLPKSRSKPSMCAQQKRSIDKIPIKPMPELESDLEKLYPIELVKIDSNDKEASNQWDALMDSYHYLGKGPLCGAQIRYLIYSKTYGYLGGLAFSAAAWRLKARDSWIGWNTLSRSRHLNEVICNSRFLILPHIKVKNLASYVLSMCIKQVCKDWIECYNIKPLLLETFVERDRFTGTCYRAANWKHIGQTKGRGRQDKNNQHAKPIKDIYVYPLCHDYQAILCDGEPVIQPDPPEPVDWADKEFGQAELDDRRRVDRLLTIARDFYTNPQAQIPQACGTRAKTKAAYRFFDETDNTMKKILVPHYKRTIERIQAEKVVLVIQDTTVLNYTSHPETQNLGPIGREKDTLIGLFLHDTMAFNLEGTPLGLLDVQCWARDPEETGKKYIRQKLPIEKKESIKWLESFKVQVQVQKLCPNTMIVNVSDRESDIYELFTLAKSEINGPKFLIRAKSNRAVTGEEQRQLSKFVSQQKLGGIRYVQVPRKKGRPPREACLEVRFAKVTLNRPHNKRKLKPLTIWAVLAEERDAPNDDEALKWLLLTNCEVNSFDDSCEKLEWYCARWQIEIYHRTLKSGCKIEQRQLGHADRIESCLAIDMVVAWRIFYLTKLGRETPNVPCTVFFKDAEWKALVAYKTHNPIPPKIPPNLNDAIRMVASLGGFLGRKCDGKPGTKSLWLGLQRLEDLTEMWKITAQTLPPQLANPPPGVQ